MKRIYDWDARFNHRNFTVADLRAAKGQRVLTQTTANNAEEAAAARARRPHEPPVDAGRRGRPADAARRPAEAAGAAAPGG